VHQPTDHPTDAAPLDGAAHNALANIAAATDDGPEVLDVPDTPDLIAGRDPSPRAGDGPQNVTQNPNAQEV